MSKINVSTITNRTGTSGPVLSGVTTATNGFHVTSGNIGVGTDNPGVELDVIGTARFTEQCTIVDGDLVIGTNGHGIDFSATDDASGSTSELLDDYEEGTWTPSLGNTGYTYTYDSQIGTYRKIGNQVTLWYRIAVSARSGSASGGTPIVVIPFTSDNSFNPTNFLIPTPTQYCQWKDDITASAGTKTLFSQGFGNNANGYFWINDPSIDSGASPASNMGSSFQLSGVFTYTST